MNRKQNIIIGIVSIVIGGMIYILWRRDNLLMFSWFKTMGIINQIECMRYYASIYYSIIPSWVYYSLPNALWLFGGMLCFFSIWEKHCYEQYIWIGIFIIIAMGAEFGQLIGIIPGTWQNSDMLLMIISIVSAIILNNKQNKKGVKNAKVV